MKVVRGESLKRSAGILALAGALVAVQTPGVAAQTQGSGRAASSGPSQPPAEDLLLKARTLYNEGRYDAAIEVAKEAEATHGHPATLLLARAGLERYRTTADPADLAAARQALTRIDPSALEPRDRTDLVIGLGEALFFDEQYRAAADLFESMLGGAAAISPATRDQVLDWWATAMDRHVRTLPPEERAEAFDRLIARMEEEARRDPGSAAAAYWVAAAAYARGHVDRAWDAAVAGWVRALLTADRGAALRPDLDRLVRDAIIPERLRRLPTNDTAEVQQAQAAMLAEWELVKERWTKQ
ncbi:MAG TPA: hypothetical protein VIL35_08190 [Vicinamibacterales bacterium]